MLIQTSSCAHVVFLATMRIMQVSFVIFTSPPPLPATAPAPRQPALALRLHWCFLFHYRRATGLRPCLSRVLCVLCTSRVPAPRVRNHLPWLTSRLRRGRGRENYSKFRLFKVKYTFLCSLIGDRICYNLESGNAFSKHVHATRAFYYSLRSKI